MPQHSAGIPQSQNQAPKQRLKSATMNKRMQRGYSKENDEANQYEDPSHQFHNYQGHLSNTDMPPVTQQYAGNQLPVTR